MKYQTFQIEIDGNKILVSDDPACTINEDFDRNTLFECCLITDTKYSLALFSKKLVEDMSLRGKLLESLLRPIK